MAFACIYFGFLVIEAGHIHTTKAEKVHFFGLNRPCDQIGIQGDLIFDALTLRTSTSEHPKDFQNYVSKNVQLGQCLKMTCPKRTSLFNR